MVSTEERSLDSVGLRFLKVHAPLCLRIQDVNCEVLRDASGSAV